MWTKEYPSGDSVIALDKDITSDKSKPDTEKNQLYIGVCFWYRLRYRNKRILYLTLQGSCWEIRRNF